MNKIKRSEFLIKPFLKRNNYRAIFQLIITLAILLIFNVRNKLFLGNNGVNFLSIFLSLLIIKIYNVDNNNIYCDEIFLLMLIPGIDASRVTLQRIYKNREEKYIYI